MFRRLPEVRVPRSFSLNAHDLSLARERGDTRALRASMTDSLETMTEQAE